MEVACHLEEDYLSSVSVDVNRFYRMRRNKWRAMLIWPLITMRTTEEWFLRVGAIVDLQLLLRDSPELHWWQERPRLLEILPTPLRRRRRQGEEGKKGVVESDGQGEDGEERRSLGRGRCRR
ncbi:hypothetical protein QJS10_CPB04g00982 [Acorus calamus]|uniref:Uncharacterized protein n=1 Tax=Acorus calamus TaxID=4465 RepID=A0AAV9EXF6_ACOCL|nr:hypothetical protein QJS10_CPB04g00982 [Acorus calamus]